MAQVEGNTNKSNDGFGVAQGRQILMAHAR